MKADYLLRLSICITLQLVVVHFSMAQCPGCIIDQTCGVGLNPIEPAVCPETLANGTIGQAYDENLTLFMPRDFTDSGSGQTVTLNSVTVTGVDNLPTGLGYQCDQPGCSYTITGNPITQRGCIKICGIPSEDGTFNLEINAIANVTTPIGTINQPITFVRPLEILDAANLGFTMSHSSGCNPVEVEFQALIDGLPNPTTYYWTFDNGNTATGQIPPSQVFITAGNNEVTLETTIWDYVLESISVTASGSGWCGDVDEISFAGVCQGAPDLFFEYANDGNTYTSDSVPNNLTASWNNLDITLNSLLFSLQFWDDDDVSIDDDLGALAFNVSGAGTFNFQNSEVFGTYTIGLVEQTVYNHVDTVFVSATPSEPIVFNSGLDIFCEGDSVLLITAFSSDLSYQWYESSSAILGAISNQLWVSQNGLYSVQVTDITTSCTSTSTDYTITVENYPPIPQIQFNEQTNELEETTSGYNYQWYLNEILLNGETSSTVGNLVPGGTYTVNLLTSAGCSNVSEPYTICVSGYIEPLVDDTICCGESVQFIAQGFALDNQSVIGWAMTPITSGAISSQIDAVLANDAGYVFHTYGDTVEFLFDCCDNSSLYTPGDYYVTPFAMANPILTGSLVYDTLANCNPPIEICTDFTGNDDNWEVFPWIIIAPDGSSYNINDMLIFGLPIDQALLDLAGGMPCINLTEIHSGDPNGEWSMSITNTGTSTLNFSYPEFWIFNNTDSCNLLSADQIFEIEGSSINVIAGATGEISFNIPPVTNTTLVDEDCEVFGQPSIIHLGNNCSPNPLSLSDTVTDATNGNSGSIELEISGGEPPYTVLWSNGNTNDSIYNLPAGTFSVIVLDSLCNEITGTFEVDLITGVNNHLALFGFSLGQNIPNPASETTVVSFNSSQKRLYEFTLRDAIGRLIKKSNITATKGQNEIVLNCSELNSGLYTYSLSNGIGILSKKMLVE